MLNAIPAFNDNYIWLLDTPAGAWVVDPGDAQPVQRFLQGHDLRLAGLLITHHHGDHTGGIAALTGSTTLPVYGPHEAISGITSLVSGGDSLDLREQGIGPVQVLAVPGHTTGHIAYYLPEQALLFCGDTLFSAGCGRLFEGTAAQMYSSLSLLSTLPGTTQVCCAHEYTLANLRFALAVEPANTAISTHIRDVNQLREAGRPSVPSLLRDERSWNPFLRCHEADVVLAASVYAGRSLAPGTETFTVLRAWKDGFRG